MNFIWLLMKPKIKKLIHFITVFIFKKRDVTNGLLVRKKNIYFLKFFFETVAGQKNEIYKIIIFPFLNL